jgi:DNA polymerase-3 subunit alpha
VFSELYEAHRPSLREDELLVVQGPVRNDDFTGGLRMTAEKLFDLSHARSKFARGLRLSMNGASDAGRLKEALLPYLVRTPSANASKMSGCPVTVCYHNGHAMCEIALGMDWRVVPDDALAGCLSEWLAATNVEFQYP